MLVVGTSISKEEDTIETSVPAPAWKSGVLEIFVYVVLLAKIYLFSKGDNPKSLSC